MSRVLSPPDKFPDQVVALLPNLYAFAIKLTHDHIRAEDLVQDAVLKALEHRHQFIPGTNLPAWLFTLLKNAYFSQYRKHHREVEDPDDEFAHHVAVESTVLKKMEAIETLKLVAQLPEHFRIPLMLAADGATLEEIALEIREHVGTVKSRINRARSMLAV